MIFENNFFCFFLFFYLFFVNFSFGTKDGENISSYSSVISYSVHKSNENKIITTTTITTTATKSAYHIMIIQIMNLPYE